MKKALLFISALLVMASGAWSQVSSLDGGGFFYLYNGSGQGTYTQMYVNEDLKSALEEDKSIFKIVDCGKTDTNGTALYNIYNVSKGQYVKWAETSGSPTANTTVSYGSSPATDPSSDVFQWAITTNFTTSGTVDSETKNWDICPKGQATSGGMGCIFTTSKSLGNLVTVWSTNTQQMACWQIYEVSTADLIAAGLTVEQMDKTVADIQTYYNNLYPDISEENLGNPGYPTSDKYNAYKTALSSLTLSDVVNTKVQSKLVEAIESTCYPNGLYRIKNYKTGKYLFQNGNIPLTFANDGANKSSYYWKVTSSSDGSLTIEGMNGSAIVDAYPQYYNEVLPGGSYYSYNVNVSGIKDLGWGSGLFYLWNTSNTEQKRVTNRTETWLTVNNTTYNSSTNPYFLSHYTANGKDMNYSKWIFEEVTGLTKWTLVVEGAPEQTGTKVTYDGMAFHTGSYSLYLSSAPSEGDFTCETIEGYIMSGPTIDAENNIITVSYVGQWESLITSFLSVNEVSTKLGETGVGFPRSSATTRSDLQEIYNTVTAEDYDYATNGESDYSTLQTRFNAYLAETNVNLPEEGKTYTFVNFHKDGTKKYLYNNSGTLAVATLVGEVPESGYFVAHIGLDGKYFFVAKNSNYHFVIARSSNDGMTNGYDTTYSPVELLKMPLSITNTTDATYSYSVDGKDVFGGFYIKGVRRDGQSNGIIIVSNTSDQFNAFHTFPVFHDNFSTAFFINEVAGDTETYFNTVNMRKAGDHSYASTYLPFAVQLPSGMKAYKGTLSGDVLNLYKIADGSDDDNKVLPANTAAILWSENATVTGNTTLTIVSSALAPIDSDLKGSLADDTAISGTAYVLSGNSSSAGFYPLNGSIAPTCKAYLDIPASVKSFSFNFEDILTGIQKAEMNDRLGEGPVYDLSGRRIEKPMRGIYIQNGRKFIIK